MAIHAQKMVPGTFHARLVQCPVCGKDLTLGGLGTISHFKKHIRDGQMTEEQSLEIRMNQTKSRRM